MKKHTQRFRKVAVAVAEAKADELEVKQGLPMNREEYIKIEAKAIQESMFFEYEKLCDHMEKSSAVLEEALQKLPPVEKEKMRDDLVSAWSKLGTIDEDSALQKDSLQAFLGLSNQVLLWIYQVAHNSFKENRHEEAQDLFFILVLLNPMVRDYWVALGYAYQARDLQERALESFSLASLLDPEHAVSRYQSAKIYLSQGEFHDALAELEVLEEIIHKQHLDFLRPHFETLQMQARNRKTA